MAFVNEYISRSDSARYDLMAACVAHGFSSGKVKVKVRHRDWTIDRGRDAFLIEMDEQSDPEFSGHAFYWKGAWIFFRMRPTESRIDSSKRSCWFKYVVKGVSVLDGIDLSEELITDLKSAITASFGGAAYGDVHRSATIEFIDG